MNAWQERITAVVMLIAITPMGHITASAELAFLEMDNIAKVAEFLEMA